MKKYIAIVLALGLLLVGCGQKAEEPTAAPTQTTAAPTETTEAAETTEAPETTAPQPKLVTATVMGDHIPVIRLLLAKDEAVEVTGYDSEQVAQVKTGAGTGTVETRFLSFPEETFEPWTAYSQWNAGLYGSFDLLGEPESKLGTNTKLEVLAELGDCYYVNYDGRTGFVSSGQVSKWQYVSPEVTQGSSGGSSSSGSGSRDGEDITMMDRIRLNLVAETTKTGSAKAKIDGVPVVIRYASLGEQIQVVAEEGFADPLPGYLTIQEPDGSYAYVPEIWVQKEGDPAFEGWEGFAGYNCKLYDNPTLSGKELKPLYGNTAIKVLWDTGTVAYIQAGEDTGFAPSGTLRTTRLPAPATEDSGGGSSHSSSSSGGGGNWTPPKL